MEVNKVNILLLLLLVSLCSHLLLSSAAAAAPAPVKIDEEKGIACYHELEEKVVTPKLLKLCGTTPDPDLCQEVFESEFAILSPLDVLNSFTYFKFVSIRIWRKMQDTLTKAATARLEIAGAEKSAGRGKGGAAAAAGQPSRAVMRVLNACMDLYAVAANESLGHTMQYAGSLISEGAGKGGVGAMKNVTGQILEKWAMPLMNARSSPIERCDALLKNAMDIKGLPSSYAYPLRNLVDSNNLIRTQLRNLKAIGEQLSVLP